MNPDILKLCALVETCFQQASNQTDITKQYAQWKSCASLAGVASMRVGLEGDMFRAACLEGVAIEARRQMAAMIPEATV